MSTYNPVVKFTVELLTRKDFLETFHNNFIYSLSVSQKNGNILETKKKMKDKKISSQQPSGNNFDN